MDNLAELEARIRERLEATAARHQENRESLRREMEEHERRSERFEAVAQRLVDEVIRPRMQMLASLFPNAHLSDKDRSTGCGCVCRFDHTTQYPASTDLGISVSQDRAMESAIITYNLEILPIFFQFEGHDQLIVPLEAIDGKRLACWLDTKLLGFADTYLKLQSIEQYQQDNMVVDPVCGMRINRTSAAATADYEGHTYYFCVEQCRQKFLTEPGRYITGRHK